MFHLGKQELLGKSSDLAKNNCWGGGGLLHFKTGNFKQLVLGNVTKCFSSIDMYVPTCTLYYGMCMYMYLTMLFNSLTCLGSLQCAWTQSLC